MSQECSSQQPVASSQKERKLCHRILGYWIPDTEDLRITWGRFTRQAMISAHKDGVLVTVWVVPGTSGDEVIGEHGGALKVRTAAPAENGKANRRVAALVAHAVGGRSGVVVAGASSRRKQVLVAGVTVGTAAAALNEGADRRRPG